MTTTAARPTYTALLSTRGIAPLYVTTLANVLGTTLQILSLSVLVYARTGSALWSSVAFAAGFLPHLLGGAVLTSLADRWAARPLLAAGALVRVAVTGTIAVAAPSPGVAIGLVAAAALVAPVPSAAQSALVARLLTGELYVLGRSVANVLQSGAQLAGLAAGGAVVATLGTTAAMATAAGVQLVGLAAAALLPRTRPVTTTRERWRPSETWRGNAVLLADRTVRRILLSWWLPTMLLVGAESLVVAYVGEGGGSASATGWLLAAFPAGAAVGDLVVGRFLPPARRQRSVPWLLALVGVGLLPLAVHPPLAATVACLAAASAGTAYQLGSQRAFLAAVPPPRHGLAFGLAGTVTMGVQGIGPVAAGAVADGLGAGRTIALLGAGVLLVAAVLGRVARPDRQAGPSARSPRRISSRPSTNAVIRSTGHIEIPPGARTAVTAPVASVVNASRPRGEP